LRREEASTPWRTGPLHTIYCDPEAELLAEAELTKEGPDMRPALFHETNRASSLDGNYAVRFSSEDSSPFLMAA